MIGKGRSRREPPHGARTSSIKAADRLNAWRRNHREAATASLERMRAAPVASTLTALMIAIALALPALLMLLLDNLDEATAGWDGAAQVTAFLAPGEGERLATVAAGIGGLEGVAAVRTMTPQEALTDFRAISGLGDALDILEENPLPATIIVTPSHTDAAAVKDLAGRIGAMEGVDSVQIDLEWVQRLFTITDLGQRLALVAAALLGVGVLLVIGNTVRLEIQSHRAEIEVEKLIGATDAFIRRPFLYGGIWLGLAGGTAALVIVAITYAAISGPVSTLTGLYDSGFRLSGPGLATILGLPLAGGLLGMAGAWLSVGHHLREIEPG